MNAIEFHGTFGKPVVEILTANVLVTVLVTVEVTGCEATELKVDWSSAMVRSSAESSDEELR